MFRIWIITPIGLRLRILGVEIAWREVVVWSIIDSAEGNLIHEVWTFEDLSRTIRHRVVKNKLASKHLLAVVHFVNKRTQKLPKFEKCEGYTDARIRTDGQYIRNVASGSALYIV